ncbi:putative DUF2061 family protein [Octadecabacter antarcticus 307]|uniref:Putative DUF2061 family protein n=1 Tax=Octadecabacter antarcticus 307 TaxID=391626 RepID=M9R3A5_9RHOB|nr:DUF2061 domain-containing protein [Octadecabacter antarcticus]AGI67104.1 putative DUF2061 family protein [Octadecabacter antarcticus 307]
MDTRKRTLIKAVIWNLIGLSVMMTVGFIATGSFAVGGAMAVVNASIGLTTYVLYERVWDRVQWGRNV